MGDFRDAEIFKRFFDNNNQWVLYDESFQKFFTWFKKNVTSNNILEDSQIYESAELKKSMCFKREKDLTDQLEIINKEYKLILNLKNENLKKLQNEIQYLTQSELMYKTLNQQIETTELELSRKCTDLDLSIDEYETQQKLFYTKCEEKAKKLQELKKENRASGKELNESFLKIQQTMPLFIHQLGLEQYFIKCDSFLQYLTLFVNGNFKIQKCMENENEKHNLDKLYKDFEMVGCQIHAAELNLSKKKIEMFGLQEMMNGLDVNKVNLHSLEQMKSESEELNKINSDEIDDILMDELKICLEQSTRNHIENYLYENIKQKFENTQKRHECLKSLTKTISNTVLNAEIIWILMQLDLEKIRNRFDTAQDLNRENQLCLKRIEIMRRLQIPDTTIDLTQSYINKLMKSFTNNDIPSSSTLNTVKLCIYEYEKFSRSFVYIQRNIENKKSYRQLLNLTFGIDSINKILSAYVFDGPVYRPMLENIDFLQNYYKIEENKLNIEKSIRHLRTEYQENIEKMTSDRLWRNKQFLWIWFLTEPKKVLNAIEEVSKTASKIQISGVKTLCGIKRK